MKPVHAQWIIGLYDHLRNSHQLIIKGFDKAGISETIDNKPKFCPKFVQNLRLCVRKLMFENLMSETF